MNYKQRIVFLGTPDLSAFLLEKMIEEKFNIVGVVTKMDQRGKRGNTFIPSPVSKVAKKYNIPTHKPFKLNKDYEFVELLKPDLILTFAYGQILSEKVLSLSKFPPLNIHTSLLPKYRGSSPIQYALKDGLTETGITLMEMVKQMDAGDIFATIKVQIDNNDNLTSLTEKMKIKSFELIKENLPLFFDNKLVRTKQDESLATFTKMITKEDEHLSLDLSCKDFINTIRSLTDTYGPYLIFNNEEIKIYKASFFAKTISDTIGKIVCAKKDKIVLQLKDGQVNLDLLQRPGKKIMKSLDFNNGFRNLEGSILK